MWSDLLKSIFDYASANETIKILSADESERLRTLVRDRFSFPENRLWWWEVMPDGASEIPYGNADGVTLLLSIVPNPNEEAYLFVTDDEWPPWTGLRGGLSGIAAMLRELRYFEYFVVGLEMTWIVFDTHYSALIGYGMKAPPSEQAVSKAGDC